MISFYFTFIFSAPYEPLIPLDGEDSALFFPEPNDPRNQALINYRERVMAFINSFQDTPQIYQWPLNIET